MFKKFYQRALNLLLIALLTFNQAAFVPFALAQEVTPEPSPEVQSTGTTQSEEPSPTPEPTVEPSPTPTPSSDQNNSSTTVDETGQANAPPLASPSPVGEPTPAATVSPTPSVTTSNETDLPNANLAVTVLENTTLTTDKADYAPTDAAIISGTGLTPNTTYILTVSSEDDPATSTTENVTTNDEGTFIYAYQLDGTYRPNYSVVLKDATGTVVATTTFTDSHPYTGDDGPVNFTASPISSSEIDLNWNNINPHTDDYHLERSPDNATWSVIATPSNSNYDNTGLECNTLYYYRVRAHNHIDGTFTNYSTTASETTSACPPDLTATKTNNAGGSLIIGNSFVWTTHVSNSIAAAHFDKNKVVFTDNLPTSGATYSNFQGPVNSSGLSGTSVFSCSLSGTNITCSTGNPGNGLDISSSGSFDVQVTVTPTAIGTLTNPINGGICRIDPNSLVDEGSNEGNNDCLDSVTVQNPGTIIIVKDAISNSTQDFTFHNNFGNGNPDTFLLDDDGNEVNALPKTRSFEVTPANYSVSEDDVAGWKLSDSGCDNGSSVDNISVSAGETVICTFTNTQLGSISGFKFHDSNGDGLWDENQEDPIEDWTIFLYQDGEVINETTTDWWEWGDWGLYSFTNLLPGTYLVCEDTSDTSYTQTTSSGNSLCPDGSNGYKVNLLAGENITGQDFGNFQKITISGMKFEDMLADGSYNPEDPNHPDHGLSGWTIRLDDVESTSAPNCPNGTVNEEFCEQQTDLSGNYSFNDLGPGTYRIREASQSGWIQTTTDPNDIVAQSGYDIWDLLFGNFKKVIITGLKWEDLNANGVKEDTEPVLGGWNIDVSKVTPATQFSTEMVQLELTSQTASDSGQFTTTVDRPETYRLTEQPQSNFQQTFPTDSFFDIFVEFSGQTTDGQDSITQDKNGNPLRFGNAPIVQLQGATFVPTSGDGDSTTSVVVLGDSTISISDNGGTSSVTLSDGTVITRTDGGTIDISDLTFDDVDESTLSGLAAGTVIDGTLQWGLPDVELTFNPAITLNIFVGTALNGQTLNIVRSTGTAGPWVNEGIGPPTTCVVAGGLCTFTATKASYYAATHTASTTSTSTSTSGGGGDGGDGLGCAVNDCSIHPAIQNLVPGVSAPGIPAAGFVPGVLGVSTQVAKVVGNVGVGEQVGQIQGEATASAQEVSSPTPEPQTTQGSSPFNVKNILVVLVILLLGFGAFKLLVK